MTSPGSEMPQKDFPKILHRCSLTQSMLCNCTAEVRLALRNYKKYKISNRGGALGVFFSFGGVKWGPPGVYFTP